MTVGIMVPSGLCVAYKKVAINRGETIKAFALLTKSEVTGLVFCQVPTKIGGIDTGVADA